MKILLSSALATLLLSGSASAADLFIAPSEPIIIDEVAYDWSGLYIGGQLGYVFGTGVVDIPAYAQPTFDVNVDGLAAGLHVGANAQFDQVVIGVEVAGNWLGADGRALSGGGGGEEYVISQDWDASLVGHLGFAADRFHVYALGGASVTTLTTTYDPSVGDDQSDTVVGWTIGLGAEYAVTDSVSAGLEYRYTDYAVGDFVHLGPSSVDLSSHAIKGRISFHF